MPIETRTMDRQSQHTRIVKLGGSLLNDPRTPRSLQRWLELQPPMTTVWIVGGGNIVDSIRRLDDIHAFPPAVTHWLCVDLMNLTSRILAAWFPSWIAIADFDDLAANTSSPNIIFSPGTWLRHSPALLPVSWDVTSDSIAAKLGNALNATEIVLLKSTLGRPPSVDSPGMPDGLVDRHCLTAAGGTPVRLVNLRDPGFPERGLVTD